jgi:exodeoxyribonuclease VII small subunit
VTNKKTEPSLPDFSQSLKKLEDIVTSMENGELSLEHALKQYEQGVALARQCQQALQEAQKRVQQLSDENNDMTSNEPPLEK